MTAALHNGENPQSEATARHVAGVRWSTRPLVDCAMGQDDPDRIAAVAAVFADIAKALRAEAATRREAAA